jgi:hypothetical protein
VIQDHMNAKTARLSGEINERANAAQAQAEAKAKAMAEENRQNLNAGAKPGADAGPSSKVDPLGDTQLKSGAKPADAPADPVGRKGEPGPNGADRPSLGRGDGPAKMSDSEYAAARKEWSDLANSGRAWDAQANPTPEYRALERKLWEHHAAIEQRIGELKSQGVNHDNPTPEWDSLQRQQDSYTFEKFDHEQQHWTVREIRAPVPDPPRTFGKTRNL